uniref:Secreted protein n=1 Tax=Pipistrellus kuhlii TaxID=59472 RepID=A0A7J7ZJR8_PIPKU|nr:hypothetical protein mPipKuh1_009425 [Pipistrellus kuhlii]
MFHQMNFLFSLKLLHPFLLQANAVNIKLIFALHFSSRGEGEPHSDVIIIRVFIIIIFFLGREHIQSVKNLNSILQTYFRNPFYRWQLLLQKGNFFFSSVNSPDSCHILNFKEISKTLASHSRSLASAPVLEGKTHPCTRRWVYTHTHTHTHTHSKQPVA